MAFDLMSQKSKLSRADTVVSKLTETSTKTKKSTFADIADRIKQDQESMYRKMTGI
jgi:hypothetical protein